MTLIQHAITRGGVNSRLDTLRSYLVRYRLVLYLLSGAAVVFERLGLNQIHGAPYEREKVAQADRPL